MLVNDIWRFICSFWKQNNICIENIGLKFARTLWKNWLFRAMDSVARISYGSLKRISSYCQHMQFFLYNNPFLNIRIRSGIFSWSLVLLRIDSCALDDVYDYLHKMRIVFNETGWNGLYAWIYYLKWWRCWKVIYIDKQLLPGNLKRKTKANFVCISVEELRVLCFSL